MKSLIKKTTVMIATLVACSIATAHMVNDSDGDHNHSPLAGHLVFKNNALHMHASFPQAPVVGAESILMLQAKNPKDHSNTELNDQVEVSLWMPSMGHGSAPTQVQRTLDSNGNIVPGLFTVRNVQFIMGGDWEIRVTLTDDQGQQETQSFLIQLNGSGHGGHGGHSFFSYKN